MAHFVFLHGVNNDAQVWEPVIAALADTHSAEALDLPALPDTSSIAGWLATRIPRGSVVVGHSFGGVVAKTLYAEYPDMVAALALINPSLRSDSPERRAQRLEFLARVDTDEKYEALAMGAMDKVFHPDYAGREDIIAERRRSIGVYGLERFLAHTRALASRTDRTEQLATADIPILVIAADSDRVTPPSEQEAWACEVGADFVEIPRTGHMLPAEVPSLVAAALEDWLVQGD